MGVRLKKVMAYTVPEISPPPNGSMTKSVGFVDGGGMLVVYWAGRNAARGRFGVGVRR